MIQDPAGYFSPVGGGKILVLYTVQFILNRDSRCFRLCGAVTILNFASS